MKRTATVISDKVAKVGKTWNELFLMYDQDGSLFMDKDEFGQMLRIDVQLTLEDLGEDELGMLWNAVDKDKSGQITVQEFSMFMNLLVSGGTDASTEYVGTGPKMNKQFQRLRQTAMSKRAMSSEDAALGNRKPVGKRFHSPFKEKLKNGRLEDYDGSAEGEASPQLLAKMSFLLTKRMKEFPSPQERSWVRMFNLVDRNGEGMIDYDEFRTLLRQYLKILKSEISDEEFKQMWHCLDEDGSGRVMHHEFAAFLRSCAYHAQTITVKRVAKMLVEKMLASADPDAPKTWLAIFAKHDDDGSMYQSHDEFIDMLRNDLSITPEEISDPEMEVLWVAIDADESGAVSAQEFSNFMDDLEGVGGHAGADSGLEKAPGMGVRLNKQFQRLRQQNIIKRDTPVSNGFVPNNPASTVGKRFYSPMKDKLKNSKLEDFDADEHGTGMAATPELLAKLSFHLIKAMKKFPDPNARSWFKLFSMFDDDKAGSLDWYEFKDMIRKDMRITLGQVAEAELATLWACVDNDGSGRIGAGEFSAFMRTCVSHAQNITIEKVAGVMTAALEKGDCDSWTALFAKHDTDGSMFMDEAEFTTMIRTDLNVSFDVAGEDELGMLWGAVDEDASGSVDASEFAAFMDRVTAAAAGDTQSFNMPASGASSTGPRMNKQFQRLRQINVQKRNQVIDYGVNKSDPATKVGKRFYSPFTEKLKNDKLEEADSNIEGQASPELLARLSLLLTEKMNKFPDPAMRSWVRLFNLVDDSGEGTLDYYEFKTMIRQDLRLPTKKIADMELKQLWACVDIDGSGRIAHNEFAGFMRACEKHAQSIAITKIAGRLNAYLDGVTDDSKRTWYAQFADFDTDGNFMLDKKEYQAMMRKHLKIKSSDVSDEELGALWKAIDDDESGFVSCGEFVGFMMVCSGKDMDEIRAELGSHAETGANADGIGVDIEPRMNKQFERQLHLSTKHMQVLNTPHLYWEPIDYEGKPAEISVRPTLHSERMKQLGQSKRQTVPDPQEGKEMWHHYLRYGGHITGRTEDSGFIEQRFVQGAGTNPKPSKQ